MILSFEDVVRRNSVKVSDAIAEFISRMGTLDIFGVSGGASLHLLNSINRHPALNLVCVHHEQTVAMAAEAYSRLTNSVGVGITTSGPGATNLVTGIAGAFYDSVPCLFITGQVSTTRMKGDLGVRQIGFQETPIVEIVKSITKLAITVNAPEEVLPTLKLALDTAISGRPGPVLVDIPDNIQRMEILDDKYFEEVQFHKLQVEGDFTEEFELFTELLSKSKKPIIVCGAGVRASKKYESIVKKIENANIPVALTWGAKDLFSWSNGMVLGTFGTHGIRKVNIALEACDLVISIGSRLDLKATGSPASSFAPRAKKIMFDIDLQEIEKFKQFDLDIDLPICIDLASGQFDSFLEILSNFEFNIDPWRSELNALSNSLNDEPRNFESEGVNPYGFITELSERVSESTNVVIDTGCAIAWTMQEWRVKKGQRLIHDFNNTAMGWSIPATLASLLVSQGRKTVCLVGDGSLMMALNDLPTISNGGDPLVIFLLNNGGYSMIKQTQDQWFKGEYFASSSSTDLHFTNYELLSKANNFVYFKIKNDSEISSTLNEVLRSDDTIFCEVMIQSDARVIPIVKFGKPNHLMDPE
jgi:acetolactate synthase-1/2/3 large subunit